MRARELREATNTKLPVISQSELGTWFESDFNHLSVWREKMYGSGLYGGNKTDRYFVFVRQGDKLGSMTNVVLELDGEDLSAITPDSHTWSPSIAQAVQQLVDTVNAKYSPGVYGNHVVYRGKVYEKKEFVKHLPVIGAISTGKVYEVPTDAGWIMSRLSIYFQESADRMVLLTVSKFGDNPLGTVSVKNGQMSDIKTLSKINNIPKLQLTRELNALLGTQSKVSVTAHLIPKGKLHKTLLGVQQNPDVERSDLYWRVLNLSKLPGYASPEDATFELMHLGLISDELKGDFHKLTHYTITPIGKLVLARLNAGKTVDKHSLVKNT